MDFIKTIKMEHWVLFVIISVIVYFMFFNKKENWGVPPNPETYSVPVLNDIIMNSNGDDCVRYPDPPYECMKYSDLNVAQPNASDDDWLFP